MQAREDDGVFLIVCFGLAVLWLCPGIALAAMAGLIPWSMVWFALILGWPVMLGVVLACLVLAFGVLRVAGG